MPNPATTALKATIVALSIAPLAAQEPQRPDPQRPAPQGQKPQRQEAETPSRGELQRQIEELLSRVEELEDQQANTADRIGNRAVAQSYTAQTLDIGGHTTSLFTYMDGNAGNAAGHVVSMFELFVKAQIDDQWSLFATPGFFSFNLALFDDPSTAAAGDPTFAASETADVNGLLARSYAQWQPDDRLWIRGGIVGTPHGTTNREYFIPSRTISLGNLHTRAFTVNQLYPQLAYGFSAGGKFVLTDSGNWIEYDAYFGVDDTDAEDPIGGARLGYVFDDLGLTVALNYGSGSRQSVIAGQTGAAAVTAALQNVGQLQSPFPTDFLGARDYEFVGVDLDWRSASFATKTEAYISSEGPYEDQRALSSEWTWYPTSTVGLSYRFDYYDTGSDEVVTSLSPFTTTPMSRGHSTEHVIGLSYDPDPSIRLRLDLHRNNLPNSSNEIDFVNFSWSFSF